MTPHDWIYVALRTVGYVCVAVFVGLFPVMIYCMIQDYKEWRDRNES